MAKINQTLIVGQPATGTTPRHRGLGNRILIKLGLRSHCCGARIMTWHHDKFYCEQCESWLSRTSKKG